MSGRDLRLAAETGDAKAVTAFLRSNAAIINDGDSVGLHLCIFQHFWMSISFLPFSALGYDGVDPGSAARPCGRGRGALGTPEH
jgi:hypothetical protein